MENIDKSLNDLLSQMNNDITLTSGNNHGHEKNQYITILKTYTFHIVLFVIIIVSVYYTKPSIFYEQDVDPKTKKPVKTFIWSKCFIYMLVIYISIIGAYYLHHFCNNKRI